MLLGGWDAFGRPWALLDCPAEKVPQLPSAHGTSRVIIAALVSFPPEPFYFVSPVHLDGAVRANNKVGHTAQRGLQGELQGDRTFKNAARTYSRVKPPGYEDSVPVQECLKEPRWSAYREGQWGNRHNPPAPAGDVREETAADVPVGERLVTSATPDRSGPESSSDSDSGSRPRSTQGSRDSSPGPRIRVRRMTSRITYSDHEEVANSTAGEDLADTATAFPVLSGPSDADLTEAVNIALAHRDQMEADEATATAASPVIVRTSRARGSLSRVSRGGGSSRGSPCRTPGDRSLSSRPVTPATPGESRFEWAPIKTESWVKFEEEAHQVTQGITGKAIDHAAGVMNQLCADFGKQIKEQVKTLLAVRDSEEFRQPGQMEKLMGWARYLWENNEELTKKLIMNE